jgi:catechol 2,3-dioxygenase
VFLATISDDELPVLDVPPSLPDDLQLGAIHLTVTDLDRSVAFYSQALGLQVRSRSDEQATMGTGTRDLLVLVAEPLARPAGRHAGLYHFALLFPSRDELARAVHRLTATRTPVQGASDHGVSEAIYLPDPDGNGIELYADRDRSAWPAPNGPAERVGMYTIALDLHGLLDSVPADDVPAFAPDSLVLGHMHLHVGDVQEAVRFYSDVLGFDVMVDMPSASFLSAGGYHHHLGVNVWRGKGVGPAPIGTVGLREWTIVLPSSDEVAAVRARVESSGRRAPDRDGGFSVRDPWGTALVVRTAA